MRQDQGLVDGWQVVASSVSYNVLFVPILVYLEFYDDELSLLQNKKGTDLWLGVDSRGIAVYERENRLSPKIAFPWSEIKNISFKDKRVSIVYVSF
jgi:hypothetical protein